MDRTSSCFFFAMVAALAGGCAAEVEIVDGTGGGSSVSSSKVNASVGTGTFFCKSHDDCPGGVCLFGIGTCAKQCDAGDFCGDGCGPAQKCGGCATSSCPQCDDCLDACVPIGVNECDADDDCTGGKQCMWSTHTCVPPCNANGGCTDPSLTCVECATGSCCGCLDCVNLCLPGTE